MFHNAVKNIELVEEDWLDDQTELDGNEDTEEQAVECNVDTRTIVGTIENIFEGVLVINVGRPKPIDIAPEMFTDLKWEFAERDTVSSRGLKF